jgi:hypothetical protein
MTGYNPKDAEGFIRLFALPITVPASAATSSPAGAEGNSGAGAKAGGAGN